MSVSVFTTRSFLLKRVQGQQGDRCSVSPDSHLAGGAGVCFYSFVSKFPFSPNGASKSAPLSQEWAADGTKTPSSCRPPLQQNPEAPGSKSRHRPSGVGGTSPLVWRGGASKAPFGGLLVPPIVPPIRPGMGGRYAPAPRPLGLCKSPPGLGGQPLSSKGGAAFSTAHPLGPPLGRIAWGCPNQKARSVGSRQEGASLSVSPDKT